MWKNLKAGSLLLCCALLMSAAGAKEPRHWQTGTIVRAEAAEHSLRAPTEIWNPWFTHWYTIATKSQLIKATEMIPVDVKLRPRGNEV